MIDLSSRRLDDSMLLERLKNMEHIVSLNIQNNKVTVQGINTILLNCAFRHDLESLNISNNQITHEIFNLLISFPCPSLKYLDLSQNSYPHNIRETTLFKRFKALYGQLQIKITGPFTDDVKDLVYNPKNVIINVDQMCKFCREMFMDKLTYIDKVPGRQQSLQNTNTAHTAQQSPIPNKQQHTSKKYDLPFISDHDIFSLDTDLMEPKYDNIGQKDALSKTKLQNPKNQQNKEAMDQLLITDLTHLVPSDDPKQNQKILEQLKQKRQLVLSKLKQKETQLQNIMSQPKDSKNQPQDDVFSTKRQELNSKLTESYKKLQPTPAISTKTQLNLQKIKISDLEFQINAKLTPQDNQKSVSSLVNHYNNVFQPPPYDITEMLSCFNRILANKRDTEVSLFHLIKEKDELVQQDQQQYVNQQQRVCNALENSKAVFDQSALQFQQDSMRLINDQIQASQVYKSRLADEQKSMELKQQQKNQEQAQMKKEGVQNANKTLYDGNMNQKPYPNHQTNDMSPKNRLSKPPSSAVARSDVSRYGLRDQAVTKAINEENIDQSAEQSSQQKLQGSCSQTDLEAIGASSSSSGSPSSSNKYLNGSMVKNALNLSPKNKQNQETQEVQGEQKGAEGKERKQKEEEEKEKEKAQKTSGTKESQGNNGNQGDLEAQDPQKPKGTQGTGGDPDDSQELLNQPEYNRATKHIRLLQSRNKEPSQDRTDDHSSSSTDDTTTNQTKPIENSSNYKNLRNSTHSCDVEEESEMEVERSGEQEVEDEGVEVERKEEEKQEKKEKGRENQENEGKSQEESQEKQKEPQNEQENLEIKEKEQKQQPPEQKEQQQEQNKQIEEDEQQNEKFDNQNHVQQQSEQKEKQTDVADDEQQKHKHIENDQQKDEQENKAQTQQNNEEPPQNIGLDKSQLNDKQTKKKEKSKKNKQTSFINQNDSQNIHLSQLSANRTGTSQLSFSSVRSEQRRLKRTQITNIIKEHQIMH